MKETYKNKARRFVLNRFPCFWMSGGKVTYISNDELNVKLKIPLKWRTKNVLGTMYGGSIYAATDPIIFITLLKKMGKKYNVWDKASTVDNIKPGKSTLFADIKLNQSDLDDIEKELESRHSTTRDFTIDLIDKHGDLCARVVKTLYIGHKKKKAA